MSRLLDILNELLQSEFLYLSIGIIILVVLFVFVSIRSIKAQKKVALAKQQLENVFGAIPGGVVKCKDKDDYHFIFVSEGFLNLVDCTTEELETKYRGSFLNTIHEDDRQSVKKVLKSQRPGLISEFEYRVCGCTNTIWVLTKSVCAFDKTNNTQCLYCVCIDITESKIAQQKLHFSNERLKAVLSQTPNIVFEYNASTDCIQFLSKANSYYGFPTIIKEGPSYFVEKGIVGKEFADNFLNCFKALSNPDTKMICMILKLMRADGKAVWNKLTLSSIDFNGTVIGTLEDITQTKEAQIRHRRAEKLNAAMVSDAIATYEINLTTNRYIKIYSKEKNNILNINIPYSVNIENICEKQIYPEDKNRFLSIYNRENLIKMFENGRLILYNEYRHLNENGQSYWVSCTTNILSDPESNDIKAFSYIKNIDKQKRKELAIKHSSERDPLTELYNRKAAQNLIEDYIEKSDKENRVSAFLSIDLDDFKHINDKHGHISGDDMLKEVSNCLKNSFRSNDIIGRMGGDEFVVFMKDVEDKNIIINCLVKALKAINELPKNKAHGGNVTMSTGIALWPKDGKCFEDLYRKSDKALYYVKNTGKNRCVFYNQNMG